MALLSLFLWQLATPAATSGLVVVSSAGVVYTSDCSFAALGDKIHDIVQK
jgi:hypothetical protein